MKRAVRILLVVVLLPLCAVASAETTEPENPETGTVLRQILNRLDLASWDRWFLAENPGVDFVPSDFLLTAALSGTVETESVWEAAPALLLASAKQALGDLLVFIGFGVLCAVLTAVRSDGGGAVSDAVLRLLGGGLVLTRCVLLLKNAADIMRAIRAATEALLPVLLTLFTAFGLSAGAGLGSGMTLLTDGMIRLATDVLFPLALVGGVLTALDAFGSDRLAPIGSFCHRAARWTLRIASALYLSVTAVRAAVAARADTLLLRSARIAAGALPNVGRLTSDAVELFAQCFGTVRSLLGVTASLALALALLRPILGMVAELLALRLAAAIVAPLGQGAYARVLDSASGMLGIAVSALAVTVTMAITVLVLTMGVFTG
ncbi:MAG: hypothetical protein IJP98_04235 [Clostridia bacterium]|nr:hypothetical protein [Clostridia bacterium]